MAACDGDHTIVGADGKSETDCTPYRCDEGTNRCRTVCSDVSGCTPPFECDFDGRCVAPPKAAAGCSASGARGAPASGALVALAVAVLAAKSRRRRLW